MTELAEFLKRYGAGEVDDQTAIETVKSLLRPPKPRDDSLNLLERYAQSLAEDDNDYDYTWQEVSGAYAMDRITLEQYTVLAHGVIGKPEEQ